MNADQLQAGRELDELVAEKVTEIAVRGEDGNLYWNLQLHSGPSCPPKYSTDIAAAWEVFLKMKRPVDDFSVPPGTEFHRTLRESHGKFACGWLWNDGPTTRWHGRTLSIADTAPLAICRAALLVKGD